MMTNNKLKIYLKMTFSPLVTLREMAGGVQILWPSVGWMMLFRVPLAWATGLMSYTWILAIQRLIKNPTPGLVEFAGRFSFETNDVLYELQSLPDIPSLSIAWPLIGLCAVLWIIGLFLHNVAWDHAGLWLLRGTKAQQSMRVSCIAIAEAMGAASFGSFLGLLVTLPIVGLFATPFISIINIYYWVLRGISLATYHGCPIWKGIVATLIHVLLVIFFYGLLFFVFGLIMLAIVSKM